jgi:hypothetical protein
LIPTGGSRWNWRSAVCGERGSTPPPRRDSPALWVLRSHQAEQKFCTRAGWVPDGAGRIELTGDVALAQVRYARPIADANA